MPNKSQFLNNKLPRILLLLSAIGFFVYTTLRAYHLSMTHDESGSYLIWINFNVFSCFIDPGCWLTANLHILYVLLMKISVFLFGDSELAIRLPSLIGHAIYLYFSWKLLKSWSERYWLILAGFIIINANPYMLDFFSLARGYGLAMTFMMMSIYCLGEFIKKQSKRSAWGMFGGAWLAVLSNLTMLNYYACLIAVLIILYTLENSRDNMEPPLELDTRKQWKHILKIGVIGSLFLALIFLMPILTMSKEGEFVYGAKTFWESMVSVANMSLYGVKYFEVNSAEILAGIFLMFFGVGFILALRRFIAFPKDSRNQFFVIVHILLALVGLATIVQHYLLGVNYLTGRKALLFIPLFAIALFLFLEKATNRIWGHILVLIITCSCIVHMTNAYQLKQTSAWGFDSQTKAMLYYLKNKMPEGEKIKLGMHWKYQPTADFYFQTHALKFLEIPKYEKEYRADNYYDYYYIRPKHIKKFNKAYLVEKRFAWYGILMKRKE